MLSCVNVRSGNFAGTQIVGKTKLFIIFLISKMELKDFGEVLFWWSIALLSASCCGFDVANFVGCFLITLLFVFISVPLIEKRMERKGEHWTQYKKECTSVLVPFLY